MRAMSVLGLVMAAAVGAALAGFLASHRSTDRLAEGVSQEKPEPVTHDAPEVARHHRESFPAQSASNWVSVSPQPKPSTPTPPPASNQSKPAPTVVYVPVHVSRVKPDAMDPEARRALSLVGADPDAEMYWLSAINNPDLPAAERKDLIEDLNEDGLSDPKHPGPEDMPLILSRIELLEEIGPDAMDEVNAAAFAEAYKDLVNLAYGRPPD